MERDRIGAIIEKVERLEKLANIQDLTQLLG
jgi:hypothetical protein